MSLPQISKVTAASTGARGPRALLGLAAAAAALILGLSGCSAPTGEDTGASDAGGTAAGAELSKEEHAVAYQKWERALAQCFRDKGVNVTDPTAEEGWSEITPEMQELAPECEAEIGAPPVRELSAAERAEGDQMRFEYETKFGECMRGLGYEMTDPKLGGASPETPVDATDADLMSCSTQADS